VTHRERLLTALELGIPDQVPVTWELVGRFAHALTGDPGWRGQCDAHRMVGSSIFNLQGVGPEVTVELPPSFAVETEELGEEGGWRVVENRILTPSGRLRERVKYGGLAHDPTLTKRVRYYVQRREDYAILAAYLEARARGARPGEGQISLAAQDYVRDDGLVNHWCPDSLYCLSNYRDPAEFLLDLMEIPDTMHELLGLIHVEREAALQAFNESAADVLVWDLCWASTSLLSPALTRRFILPEAQWAVNSIRPGKYIVFFVSGRVRDVLPDLAALRPHGIQHLDVLGDCDLAEVKRTFAGQFCVMGNYNPVILARGSVEEAREEARRCLRAGMAGGGYIMTSSDEVPADARLESMQAVVELVAQEGRY
jgi:hypothetical protein